VVRFRRATRRFYLYAWIGAGRWKHPAENGWKMQEENNTGHARVKQILPMRFHYRFQNALKYEAIETDLKPVSEMAYCNFQI